MIQHMNGFLKLKIEWRFASRFKSLDAKFEIIQESLSSFSLNIDIKGVFIWNLNLKKSYTVKSSYNKLVPSRVLATWVLFTFTWNKIVLLRSTFSSGNRDSLIKKGIATPSTCFFCSHDESTVHIFVQYEFIFLIWHIWWTNFICFLLCLQLSLLLF